MAFILYLWVTGVFLGAVAVGVPVLLGRLVLDRLVGHTSHDGYSFTIGASSLWAFVTARSFVIERYRSLQAVRRGWWATRPVRSIATRFRTTEGPLEIPSVDPLYYEIGRIVMFIGKIAILTVTLGLVIPLLLALVVELYIILPVRIGVFAAEERTPTIYIWEDWALGLVLCNVAIRMARLQNPPAIVAAWDTVSDNVSSRYSRYQCSINIL